MAPLGQLKFEVVDGWSSTFLEPPYVILRRDNWDDFGFKTLYGVEVRVPGMSADEDLGGVKILRRGQQGQTPISRRFKKLGDDYCSLGQDIEYYEKLMRLPGEFRRAYLTAMRDAAQDESIEHEFSDELGWQTSLLRFGQAENALSEGRKLLHGNEIRSDRMSFQYNWNRAGRDTSIRFKFDDSAELPGRCHALIGYNGVGKTTLLADLANTASNLAKSWRETPDPSTISGRDTTFGAVITVSYSAFDTFSTPRDLHRPTGGADVLSSSRKSSNAEFGYVYCGLRRPKSKELKSIDEIQSEFVEALRVAQSREDGGHLEAALATLNREPSFGHANVDLLGLGAGANKDLTVAALENLSTGHQIVLNIVAQLAAHLQTRSLVLIDEPETHLHPPLVAALLRAIQKLLEAHGSFAIVATHSPVVVQELPSEYVRVLQRYGGSVIVRPSEIETFAENIGAITRHVFSLDSSATDYQGVLATLADNFTVEEIDGMFQHGLSVQGRALVASYLQQRS